MAKEKSKIQQLAEAAFNTEKVARMAKTAFFDHAFTVKASDKTMVDALKAAGFREKKAQNSVKSHRELRERQGSSAGTASGTEPKEEASE
jgi:hypothetical protein